MYNFLPLRLRLPSRIVARTQVHMLRREWPPPDPSTLASLLHPHMYAVMGAHTSRGSTFILDCLASPPPAEWHRHTVLGSMLRLKRVQEHSSHLISPQILNLDFRQDPHKTTRGSLRSFFLQKSYTRETLTLQRSSTKNQA